jgi:hypothetical protein
MSHPILGNVEPDKWAKLLNTGYLKFQSPTGIGGLCKFTPERLDLLVVHAAQEGKGQFRYFIHQAKQQFQIVCVWEVWNPRLDSVLERYGFLPVTEIHNGETVTGRRWDKP